MAHFTEKEQRTFSSCILFLAAIAAESTIQNDLVGNGEADYIYLTSYSPRHLKSESCFSEEVGWLTTSNITLLTIALKGKLCTIHYLEDGKVSY